jgi:hypothetical protein
VAGERRLEIKGRSLSETMQKEQNRPRPIACSMILWQRHDGFERKVWSMNEHHYIISATRELNENWTINVVKKAAW